ncbi:MAG: GNAT family N-acetyltransferase [Tannerellaceae bacterium]|jgi:GNAT superfamily N-acetyltransferase|nr:GNAT family N-acetyltransferase [Tannerellaceae bacterium]
MDSKKEQIIQLWQTVFQDSDAFIHLYFEQVYKDENAFVIEKNGQIISALQMHPYPMSFCGEELLAGYISGVCTLPSERGKGWMSKLLQNVSGEMKRRNIALSTLIPAEEWLFGYYRSRGYTETFAYSIEVYLHSEHFIPASDAIVVQQEREPKQIFYTYFERKLRERPVCILHTYKDFAVILEDMELSGGFFFAASNPAGIPVGLAFVFPSGMAGNAGEESVLCKEILYDNEETKQHLLYAITHRLNVHKVVCRIPASTRLQTYPYGMAQMINPEPLIGLWLATHPESHLSAAEMKSMDRHLLTRRLLASPEQTAYMSLMLD